MRVNPLRIPIGTGLIPLFLITLSLRAQAGPEPAADSSIKKSPIVTQEERLIALYQRERDLGAEGSYRYAREIRAAGLLNRAMNLYENFLVLFPDHTHAFDATIDLAEMFRDLNRFRKAARIFESAYAMHPDQERGLIAYLNAARIYSDLGEKKKAERILNEIIARRPFSPASRMARADLLLKDSTRRMSPGSTEVERDVGPPSEPGEGAAPDHSPAGDPSAINKALDRMGEGVERMIEK